MESTDSEATESTNPTIKDTTFTNFATVDASLSPKYEITLEGPATHATESSRNVKRKKSFRDVVQQKARDLSKKLKKRRVDEEAYSVPLEPFGTQYDLVQDPNTSATTQGNRTVFVTPNSDGGEESVDGGNRFGRGTQYRGSFTLRTLYYLQSLTTRNRASTQTTSVAISVPSAFKTRVRNAVDTLASTRSDDFDRGDHSYSFSFTKVPQVPDSLQFEMHTGFEMLRSFLFPSLPRPIRDIWVLFELVVFISYFVFHSVSFVNTPLRITIEVLSGLALLLALFDSSLHYVNKCFRSCSWSESCNGCCWWCSIYDYKVKSELIRLILSNFILYGLIIADFIDFLVRQSYLLDTVFRRVDFSLFILLLLYFVSTVYFMLVYVAINSVVCIQRLPKRTTYNYTCLLLTSCLHIVIQVFSHIWTVIMVATAITSETCEIFSMTNKSSIQMEIQFSGYLWYEVVAGGFLQAFGIAVFFVIYYPSLKRFSLAFYIDIVSNIADKSFVDAIDEKKVLRYTVNKVLQKNDLAALTSDFETYCQNFTVRNKILYCLTQPKIILSVFTYALLVGAFFVCHLLVYSETHSDLCDSASILRSLLISTFSVGILIIVLANLQAVAILLILAVVYIFVVTLPPMCFVYTPLAIVILLVYHISRKSRHAAS